MKKCAWLYCLAPAVFGSRILAAASGALVWKLEVGGGDVVALVLFVAVFGLVVLLGQAQHDVFGVAGALGFLTLLDEADLRGASCDEGTKWTDGKTVQKRFFRVAPVVN